MGSWTKDPAPVLLNGYGFEVSRVPPRTGFPVFRLLSGRVHGGGMRTHEGVAIPTASPGMICGLSGPKSATHPGIHARGSRAGVSGRFVPFVTGNPEGLDPR